MTRGSVGMLQALWGQAGSDDRVGIRARKVRRAITVIMGPGLAGGPAAAARSLQGYLSNALAAVRLRAPVEVPAQRGEALLGVEGPDAAQQRHGGRHGLGVGTEAGRERE